MSIETSKQKELPTQENSGPINAPAFENAMRLFPPGTAALLRSCGGQVLGAVEEIRVYADKAVVFRTGTGPRFCMRSGALSSYVCRGMYIPGQNELEQLVNAAADHALFLREKDLRSAFLTAHGCRVAISGFSPEGKLQPGGISSVNIRLPFAAPQYTPDPALVRLLGETDGLLAAGPPGCGKTTFLKKCAALLAGKTMGWRSVAVIDERGEFFSALHADPQVITADILRGTDKAAGIQTALRLFSPEYIICDEIGNGNETAGMLEGMNSGVTFLASIHAGSPAQLFRRPQFTALWEAGVFRHILFLSAQRRGQVEKIICREEEPQ